MIWRLFAAYAIMMGIAVIGGGILIVVYGPQP